MCYMMWNRTGGITRSSSPGVSVGTALEGSLEGSGAAGGRGRRVTMGRCSRSFWCFENGKSSPRFCEFAAMYFVEKTAPETSAPARAALGSRVCPGPALTASRGAGISRAPLCRESNTHGHPAEAEPLSPCRTSPAPGTRPLSLHMDITTAHLRKTSSSFTLS